MAATVSDILERMREILYDEDKVKYPDDVRLTGGIRRYVEDTYGPRITRLEVTMLEDGSFSPEIPMERARLVAMGAALRLLYGLLVSAADETISTDSATGRINTQTRAEEIREAVKVLTTEYQREAYTAGGQTGLSFVDVREIAAGRIEGGVASEL